MSKELENINRLKKMKNVRYVKVDNTPRLSEEQAKELKKLGLYLNTFCFTDDGDDVYLSYFPRRVNHDCDVIATADLGVTADPEGLYGMSYDELDEAGAIEEECLEDFIEKLPKEKAKKAAKILNIKINLSLGK